MGAHIQMTLSLISTYIILTNQILPFIKCTDASHTHGVEIGYRPQL